MDNTIINFYRKISGKHEHTPSNLKLEGLISNIQIQKGGSVELTVLTASYPCCEDICTAEELFEEALNTNEVLFRICPAADDRFETVDYLQWALRHIEKKDFFIGAFLKMASYSIIAENAIGFSLHDGCDEEAGFEMESFLSEFFKKSARKEITFRKLDESLNISDVMEESIKTFKVLANKKRDSREAVPSDASSAKEKAGQDKNRMGGKNSRIGSAKKNDYIKMKQPEGVIWGRMNTNLSVVPMDTLSNETGPVMIEGSVFGFDTTSISNGTKTLVKFCLTDRTNSVQCIVFMKPDEAADFEDSYKNADLRICAEVGFDSKFEKDIVARISGIQLAVSPARKADHAPLKRVELHCHTKMSSKDSVCEVSEVIETAARYGHEAIAITDHGVVQAFPEAREAQLKARKKGKDIKIIYGVECYLVDDGGSKIAYQCESASFEEGFVAVDIKTSGDDPSVDRIVSIDAVLYEKGENGHKPADEFHFTCDHQNERSPDSGYHDKNLFKAAAGFNSFIGDRPLAGEDIMRQIEFLRYEGFRTEKETEPHIKFYQPLIDTACLAKITDPADIEMAGTSSAEKSAGRILSIVLKDKGIGNTDDLNRITSAGTSSFINDTKNHYHCILLARDPVGLYGLYRLVSQSHLKYIYKDRPRIPRSLLAFFRTGMLVGSACESGELFMKVMEHYDSCGTDFEKAVMTLDTPGMKETAGFYDYLEIQPVGNNRFMLRTTEKKGQIIPSRYKSADDLKNLDKLVARLGKLTGKPVCATCDVHFLQPSDFIYREIMQSDMGYSDANLQAPLFFRTTDEMLDEFGFLGEEAANEIVIQNPKKIAAMIMPDMKPFPEGTFPPVIATAADDIEVITWQTARMMYEKDGIIPEVVKSRIEKELKSIIGNGFAIMYYIAYKLVKKSNDDGYVVGSRGSVGSSLVATLCGITEVNPLEPHYYCTNCRYSEFGIQGDFGSGYDLPVKICPECGNRLNAEGQDIPFETFMGFDGDKQPDIDLNFSGLYQAAAHKFIEEMFGSSHTFRAGTISGYAEKNAISMVLKYFDAKEKPVTRAETIRLAKGLIGVKRTTGQHPGGIVVVPKERDIYDFTPVQCPADRTENGIVTTHFDFNSLHDTILKLDILGHDDPTMLKVLGDMTGIDIRTIPIPDEEVMKLFISGEPLKMTNHSNIECGTLGLPELGTFMARGMIKDTRPSRFYDLVQLMGLSHGTDVWKGNAQDLIRNGTCSISQVIGCRDSIMTSLVHWGLPPKSAFSIMEKVRKGKGLTEDEENLMIEKGVPEWYIESCKKIKYILPKAHAAAYSISALRIAWFKVYRKAEYYCAFFTVRADEFDSRIMCRGFETVKHFRDKLYQSFREKNKISMKINGKEEEFSPDKAQKMYYILELIEEMYYRGIEFLPVDIYQSDASHFIKVSETQIRPPLNTLPSLSDTIAANIVAARAKTDKFLSREDFAKKAGIGDTLMTMLAAQGCLDGLMETNQIDLFSLLA
ncbi:MAG: PolC-type DNA polymerase III [Saccharofermentanales bacterium]